MWVKTLEEDHCEVGRLHERFKVLPNSLFGNANAACLPSTALAHNMLEKLENV